MEFLDGFKVVDPKRIPGAIGGVLVKVTSFLPSGGYPSEYPKHPERREEDSQGTLDFEEAGSMTATASAGFYED